LTQVPFTLAGYAATVAVTDRGVYVADTGQRNDVDPDGGWTKLSNDGRAMLLETGATVQKDVATKVGAPISMAVGRDGAVYLLTVVPDRVVQYANGSTTPVPLPFKIGGGLDSWARKIAVTPDGDIVLLTDRNIQILSKGAQAPTVLEPGIGGKMLAVDRRGAIYFVGGFDDVKVIEKGATEPRTLEKKDETDPAKRIVAMAFDSNNDRYAIYATCGPNQPPGQIRPCNTDVFTVRKFADNSTSPTDIPVQGLTSPTSMAVSATDIYIADGKRIVKTAKQ